MRSCCFLVVLIALPLVLPAALPVLEPSAYYSPSKFVLNFHLNAAPSQIILHHGVSKTGIAALDRLNREFGVFSYEKLFPGSAPDNDAAQLSGYYLLRFSGNDQIRLESALQRFAALPQVEHVEPVSIHKASFIPNDPSFSSQWFHNQPSDHDIDSPEAWDIQRGDTVPIIGIADSGVLWTHPDLAHNIWKNWAEVHGQSGVDDDGNGCIDDSVGWDWVNETSGWPGEDYNVPDNDPSDFCGHGTHIAGLVAGITNNGVGGAGIAGGSYPTRGARIMCLRIGWMNVAGDVEYDMSCAAQAFYYAANKGATVMNCSWKSYNTGGLGAAVGYAITHGMTICTSANNDNNQTAYYLCTLTDVIAVAATDQNDVKANFSNYGTWVDVSAPGVSIYSTYSDHYVASYEILSGTSMSAAMVTGLVALLKSQHPQWNRSQITWQILHTTDNIDIWNPSYIGLLGTGRINLHNALVGAAQITINSPNGGETWFVGDTHAITWSSTLLTDSINIYINRTYPNGIWEKIFSSVPNTGSKAWMVQGVPSPACRLRLEDDLDTLIRDTSNANFSIGNGTGAPVTLFQEGFEDNFNNDIYSRGDDNPANGPDYWDVRPQRPHSGAKSCYCAGYGSPTHPPYDDYMSSYFYQKPDCGVSLAGFCDVTFKFWIWYDTQPETDFVKVQCFLNSGWVDFPNSNWSGNSGGWVQKTYSLTSFSNFRFRFQFNSDSAGHTEGAYVDDILITGIPAASNHPTDGAGIVELIPEASPTLGQIQATQPGNFDLWQIAPNPFNASTVISYELKTASFVKLTVWNTAGKLVATLVDGWSPEGTHSAIFDGHSLPSGIYLLRLQTGTLTATRKMVLLK